MKQKQSWFLRIPVLCAAVVGAILGASLFHALRSFWVFYDPNTFFLGGSIGIFVLSLAAIALLITLLALRVYVPRWKGKEAQLPKAMRVCAVVGFVLAALILVAVVVILCFSGEEAFSVFSLYLKKDLPPVLIFTGAAALFLLMPLLSGKKKAVFAGVMVLCIVFSCVQTVFPLQPYRFVSAPVVMDTGEEYAVVFATSQQGTGYIHYTFEGKEYTVYAQEHGRRIGDRMIHSVRVPHAHLKNNEYQIGSTRVIEQFGYGSRLGKDIQSETYTLRVKEDKTQKLLVVSDWHTRVKQAKQAITYLEDYDAVVMLGDSAGSMDFEEQAVRYIVQFGGDITHGAMPVYYVRGNHETRGAFAAHMPEYLGYDSCYYRAQRGEYSFLILDSGEDKEDAHIEYGGMDEYAHQRSQMLDWLNEQQTKQGEKFIVFSHDWKVSEPEPEVSRAAWDKLQSLGARFMVSGHYHVCEFLEKTNETAAPYLTAYPDIATYIDGGVKKNVVTVSKLTLTEQGVRFEAADNLGQKVMDTTLPWGK
ncbi:MAG: metallophosphoesterase [Clostridia bacterium]|nr:metallophosphoesterase [Clostridia bacterium]